MTGDNSKFVKWHLKHEGHVTYGDNNIERILDRGTAGDKNTFLINEVLFVEGLKHNLLSISHLCDKNYQLIFKPNIYEISLSNTQGVLLIGKRINNIYLLDISVSDIDCLLTKHEKSVVKWALKRTKIVSRGMSNHCP